MDDMSKGTVRGGDPRWVRLLPKRGSGWGVSPISGRATVPMAGIARTVLPDGHAVRVLRAAWQEHGETFVAMLVPGSRDVLRVMGLVRGGETVEFAGRPRPWRDTATGETMMAVVCEVIAVTPTPAMALRRD